MKQKSIAGVLGLIFGVFGVHHFYLGHQARGIMHFLLFLFTFALTVDNEGPFILLPALIGFIGGILLLVMPQEEFDQKYNREYIAPDSRLRRRPVRRTDPMREELQALKTEGIRAFRARDYEDATDAFLDALDIDEGDASLHFNLACCYSQMQVADLADEHLIEALENGFDRWDKIDNHPALKWYREQQVYVQLLKRFQSPPAALPAPQNNLFETPAPVMEEKAETTPAPLPLDTTDLLEQITRLGELRERGILTEDEFALQKRRILGR